MKENDLKEKFEGRIRNYMLKLVEFLNAFPKNLVTREVISQLMRSGTSIGANYFESKGASSKKDYQNYFTHSLKSSNESKFWLSLILDGDLVPKQLISEGNWLLKETKEFANIFASSILTMKGRR